MVLMRAVCSVEMMADKMVVLKVSLMAYYWVEMMVLMKAVYSVEMMAGSKV